MNIPVVYVGPVMARCKLIETPQSRSAANKMARLWSCARRILPHTSVARASRIDHLRFAVVIPSRGVPAHRYQRVRYSGLRRVYAHCHQFAPSFS